MTDCRCTAHFAPDPAVHDDDCPAAACPHCGIGDLMGHQHALRCPVRVADPDLERCAHGRYRIDPCLGCGRRYEDGRLVGEFLR